MKRKAGTLLMILGTVLVVLALSLFLTNQQEEESAELASQEALDTLWPVILHRADATTDTEQGSPEGLPVQDYQVIYEAESAAGSVTEEASPMDAGGMTVVEIRNRYYVGVVSIPALGLELPVLAELNDADLELAPCRYAGGLSTQDLVIGAHNYISHFAKIWRLQPGARIMFTDMDGHSHEYEVEVVETISPMSNDYLVAGDYPLTLFTCTYTGNNRTAVRCVEVK